MKIKDIEKQLKQDVGKITPPSNFNAIKEKCVLNTPNGNAYAMNNDSTLVAKRAGITIILSILLAIIALTSIILVNQNKEQGVGYESQFLSSGHLVLDINPSIEIAYDKNGNITSVTGLNEDGEVVLVGVDIVGKNYKEAISELVERCVDLGYFSYDREDNAILASAVFEDGTKDATMSEIIQKTILDEFSRQKLYGVVIEGTEKDEYKEIAKSYGISAQKYDAIISYINMGGDLEESEFKDISMRELYDGISKLYKNNKKEDLKRLENELEAKKNEIDGDLSQCLGDLILELEKAIDRTCDNSLEKSFYENQINSIKEQIEKFGDTTETKDDINKIASMLETMNNFTSDEELKAYIEEAISEIDASYGELLKIDKEINDKNKTPEDINNEREEQFSTNNDNPKPDNIDIEKWQEEKKEEIKSSWDDIKNSWQNDRKEELKKPLPTNPRY